MKKSLTNRNRVGSHSRGCRVGQKLRPALDVDLGYLMIIKLFDRMVDAGNSVFLIEHNLTVFKSADYAIELGPGGGEEGWNMLFCGRPEDILRCERSVTAGYLR